MTARLLSIALLTLVYLFTLASFALWDIAIGAVLAIAVTWLFRGFAPARDSDPRSDAPSFATRLIHFPLFCAVVVWDIIKGTWVVSRVVLGFDPLRQPGIVHVPIGERSRLGVVVSSIATTLSPGTFIVDIDWTERVMLIHALDASDPDAVRAAHQHVYDRYQRKVFP
jgi:multisubunit Na+/H+ antiporter MnhE subunit